MAAAVFSSVIITFNTSVSFFMLLSAGCSAAISAVLGVVAGVPPASVVALASRSPWSLWCFWNVVARSLTDDDNPSVLALSEICL